MLDCLGSEGDRIVAAFQRVFGEGIRPFGSRSIGWRGLSDGNEGVQWNVGSDPREGEHWIAREPRGDGDGTAGHALICARSHLTPPVAVEVREGGLRAVVAAT